MAQTGYMFVVLTETPSREERKIAVFCTLWIPPGVNESYPRLAWAAIDGVLEQWFPRKTIFGAVWGPDFICRFLPHRKFLPETPRIRRYGNICFPSHIIGASTGLSNLPLNDSQT